VFTCRMIVTHRSIIILTSAAESGASIFKMVEVSRHKSVDTLRGYVRRVDLFKEHAGAAFLCSCDPMEEIMPSARRHILYCQPHNGDREFHRLAVGTRRMALTIRWIPSRRR
jgi:hypothetical protein